MELFVVFSLLTRELSNDEDSIRENNSRLLHAKKILSAAVQQMYGDILSDETDEVIFSVEDNHDDKLLELRERMREESRVNFKAGIGASIEEARTAAEQAQSGCYKVMIDAEDLSKAEVTDEDKESIARSLQAVAQNKDVIAQLKDQQPEVYVSLLTQMKSLMMILGDNSGGSDSGTNDESDPYLDDFQHGDKDGSEPSNSNNQQLSDIDEDDIGPEQDVHETSPLSKEIRQSQSEAISLIQKNKDVVAQLSQANPDVQKAIMGIIQAVGKIVEDNDGIHPAQDQAQSEIEASLDPNRQEEKEEAGTPERSLPQTLATSPAHVNKDPDIHRAKLEFAPGAIRQYSPQNTRVKNEDGSWSSLKTVQEPQDGGQ